MKTSILVAALSVAGFLTSGGAANAQVAGSTVGVAAGDIAEVAHGWSARKNILGKALYNDTGETIGKVTDVIIAPNKKVSYLIVGAGGFVGIGRHDVAIPSAQVQEKGGRLVMSGATKDAVKAMPPFEYAGDTTLREQFIARADQDLAEAKARMAEFEKKSVAVSGDAKVKLDQQSAIVQKDMKAADEKLTAMKHAGAKRWKEFEGDVDKAIARLKLSIDKAIA